MVSLFDLSQRNTSCSGDMESCNGGRCDQFVVNRDAVMERQLEKERIRREILEEEAARRRELEAEVRRELRIERELELKRRGSDQWEAPMRGLYVECGLFEKRVALPFQEKLYDIPGLEQEKKVERMYDHPLLEQENKVERMYDYPLLGKEKKIAAYEEEEEELPFQSQLTKTEVKTPLAEEKKQNILLAEPDANHPGKKRKDMASPGEGPSEVTKKLANEWICDLCQISVTSELGLKDHFKGKKHKSKQAGLKAGTIGLFLKKIIDPLDPSQVAERNVESEESQQTSNKYEAGVESNDINIVKEKGCGGAVQEMPEDKIMNFKFYCKMCEVGTYSEKTMNSHNKGKKHLRRLHQLGAKI